MGRTKKKDGPDKPKGGGRKARPNTEKTTETVAGAPKKRGRPKKDPDASDNALENPAMPQDNAPVSAQTGEEVKPEGKPKRVKKLVSYPASSMGQKIEVVVSEAVGCHYHTEPEKAPKEGTTVLLKIPNEEAISLLVRKVQPVKSGKLLVWAFTIKGAGSSVILARHKGDKALVSW